MKLVPGYADVEVVDDFVDSLATIAVEHDCTVQAVDARYVAGRTHLTRALELADRAIDRDVAIARDRSVELLLSVAATRQIERAFEIGVSAGQQPVVILVDASSAAEDATSAEQQAATDVQALLEPAAFDDIVGDEARIREWFDIDDTEREVTTASLEALVCERVALLALER